MKRYGLPTFVRAAVGPQEGTGFTLVELLVVVAIVALLVAIIMPTVTRAQELARQAVCLGNHRSMVTALKTYHTECGTFPYNYAFYDNTSPWGSDYKDKDPKDKKQRWALGCISPYLTGGQTGRVYLRRRDEGEFPKAYVCPSADLSEVYRHNPDDKYHACYWTNICIRVNRGWRGCRTGSGFRYGGGLFGTLPPNQDHPPGYDKPNESVGMARVRKCYKSNHWRSVYNPHMGTVPVPAATVFTGCTNDKASHYTVDDKTYHYHPGQWDAAPGRDRMHGSLSFDRHDDSQLMSYLDGSAKALSHEYMDENYYCRIATDNSKIQTGAFLIEYTRRYSCLDVDDKPTQIHTLPPPVVD